MKISLGVVDIPYSDAPGVGGPKGEAKGRPKLGGAAKSAKMKQRKTAAHVTTGDVGQILEAKYALLGTFAQVHGQDIANDVADSYTGALETMMMTGRIPPNPAAGAMSKITQRMKDWVTTGEAEKQGIAGVPTEAALRGVSHRLKHPYAKGNPRRVSFRDTGLLVGAFVAFTDEAK